MKGTPSMGRKAGRRSHIQCRRCGKRSFHTSHKICASCGYGNSARQRKSPGPK